MDTSNQHTFDLLTAWGEIEDKIIASHVRPFIKLAKSRSGKQDRVIQRALPKEVSERMKEPMHKQVRESGVICALHYIYKVIRVGVRVCIRDNAVTAFIPFANADYLSNWADVIRFEKRHRDKQGHLVHLTTDRVDEYVREKMRHLKEVRPIEFDKTKWSANAFFVNSSKRDDVWGTHSLSEFYDMINTTLRSHQVSDCIFFLNKRDFPLLRKDLHEPSDYLDLPFPIAEDWRLASEPQHYFNADKLQNDWDSKIPTAFFRGSLTGRVDPQLNPRAILATLDAKWAFKKYLTTADGRKIPLLDAGITSWNLVDKVNSDGVVTFTHPGEMPFKKANRVSMDESVRNNLSNLEERIRWCIANDVKCKEIVARAKAFSNKYFTQKVITKYVASTLLQPRAQSC
ncbi:unnamed protein product [Phytophthora lilii]|uniref:Unnamed protein product n=1 Tax=Phytophthora lilii TaxID=2077276 RepID=A0A9W6TFB6_9STRA|nr:unnamed protein product [Phytophthora lilii]